MSGRLRDFRAVTRPVGAVVIGLGVAIALCALVGWLFDLFDPHHGPSGGAIELLMAAVVTLLVGGPLLAYGRRHEKAQLTRREAVLAVALIWVAAGICGAIPFVLAGSLSPADAFFESISGLTTTGATVITDIEGTLSRPILLWRSLIQWLGGMGIVVLFVAVFPGMGAGGKHLYRGEVPGTTAEGLKPRIAETSITLWKIYALFTVLELLILTFLGMSLFESLCHSLTTMSTGGFSTRDASVGGFDSAAIELVIAAFMLIGSVNYGLYYSAMRGRTLSSFWRNVEFRVFVFIVLISTAVMTLGNLRVHGGDIFESFRYGVFMVATTISSTGYGTDDYTAYPPLTFAVMVFLMFIGGSSGSTAGGIKIERIVLITKQTWVQVKKNFRPAVVEVVRMGRRTVPTSVIADVLAFFAIYMGTLAAGMLAITVLEDVSVETAFGAMLTSISNMGPAPFHEGSDNFAVYSPISKIVFAVVMLLGRLELFTLFALLVPEFWRR